MAILIGIITELLLPLAIVAAMHFWIGSYPQPLPATPAREPPQTTRAD